VGAQSLAAAAYRKNFPSAAEDAAISDDYGKLSR
jgi:hypothetical protein